MWLGGGKRWRFLLFTHIVDHLFPEFVFPISQFKSAIKGFLASTLLPADYSMRAYIATYLPSIYISLYSLLQCMFAS